MPRSLKNLFPKQNKKFIAVVYIGKKFIKSAGESEFTQRGGHGTISKNLRFSRGEDTHKKLKKILNGL